MSAYEDELQRGMAEERAGDFTSALLAYRGAAQSDDPDTRAEAFTRIADIHRERCEWDEAEHAARQAQAVALDAGLDERLANARIAEANSLMTRGKFAKAMPLFHEIGRSASNSRVRGVALQNIGSMKAQLGRFDEAKEAFEESLANFEAVGYAKGKVIARNNLGRLALDRRDFAVAVPLLQAAMEEASAIGHSELVALAQENLASVLCETGDLAGARSLAADALVYFESSGNGVRQIECLRLLAMVEEKKDNIVGATRYYERALRIAEEIGSEVEITVTRHRLQALRS